MANGYPDPAQQPLQPMFAPGFGQGLQGMFGGLKRGYQAGNRALHPYSNRLLLAGMGLLSREPDAMGQAMKGLVAGSALDTEDADRTKLNKAIQELMNDPESGGLMQGFTKAQKDYIANDPAAFRTVVAGKLGGGAGGRDRYGQTPIWGTDAAGNPVLLQMGTGGDLNQPDVPEGVTLNPSGNTTIKTATETIVQDRFGNIISRIPNQVQEGARQQKVGEAQGIAEASIPKVRQSVETMRGIITGIKNDPNMEIGVGLSSAGNRVWGSPGLEFQKRSDQLKGQAFLQAYESLRGANAITEQEGMKATDAMTRIDTALDKQSYLDALADLEAVVNKAEERARERAGQAAPSGGAPAVGTIEDGHRFLGGDPADSNNWEPVQ